MSKPPDRSRPTYVYLRVAPAQVGKDGPSAGAFLPGTSAREGLSVYAANIVTPRQLLQRRIDQWQEQLAEKQLEEKRLRSIEHNLRQCPTPEAMVQIGWRILEIEVAALEERAFDLSDIDQDDPGHMNIRGDQNYFRLKSTEFLEMCREGTIRVLSTEDCAA